jgi:hypothetical protein
MHPISDKDECEVTAELLRACLQDLIYQILSARLIDADGHDFRMSDSFVRAMALLEQLEDRGHLPRSSSTH